MRSFHFNMFFCQAPFFSSHVTHPPTHHSLPTGQPLLHSISFLSVLRQGGGKRKGSIAVYLEPWHADIVSFLDLKKNHGNELERARDLFYAMWIPDLFMQVQQ